MLVRFFHVWQLLLSQNCCNVVMKAMQEPEKGGMVRERSMTSLDMKMGFLVTMRRSGRRNEVQKRKWIIEAGGSNQVCLLFYCSAVNEACCVQMCHSCWPWTKMPIRSPCRYYSINSVRNPHLSETDDSSALDKWQGADERTARLCHSAVRKVKSNLEDPFLKRLANKLTHANGFWRKKRLARGDAHPLTSACSMGKCWRMWKTKLPSVQKAFNWI